MKNKRLIISWSLLIGWMLLIFFMSNQPADISNKQSDLAINLFSIIGIDLNNHLGEIASFVVRKAAHFTEYFILYCFYSLILKHAARSFRQASKHTKSSILPFILLLSDLQQLLSKCKITIFL